MGISCVISTAVSAYFMQGWLGKYTYHIDMGYGAFLFSSALAILITVLTIGTQAIRAAMMNPVTSLRSN